MVYDPEARTNVGVAKRDKDSSSPFWYLDTEQWLYANYCEYCHNSGTRPVSLRRFVTLLSDLGKNQLGLDIRKERDRFGSYFVGLKIRAAEDDLPPMITGNTDIVTNVIPQPKNTNVISKLWTMVMNRVTDMMDYVLKDTASHMMDETIDNDECYGCDGKNEKFSESENNVKIKTNCSTKNEGGLKERVINNEFSIMPSQVAQLDSRTHTGLKVKDNSNAITVKDRVSISDYPGHWSWASPFTVEATDEPFRVNELIEITRLSKCPR